MQYAPTAEAHCSRDCPSDLAGPGRALPTIRRARNDVKGRSLTREDGCNGIWASLRALAKQSLVGSRFRGLGESVSARYRAANQTYLARRKADHNLAKSKIRRVV
jgi:hypothetical protein